ncbi:DUF2840 domain-containing protein [Acetobacter sp. LMG 32666]|uniref:DUF2840 domain-containing protein n=1 Tax=Acetobacter sp. LMG 32666 TaxID=2959295 RepID=UPI0038D23EBE
MSSVNSNNGGDELHGCEESWRHVHNRIIAGQEPRPYTQPLHAAWLKRARLVS